MEKTTKQEKAKEAQKRFREKNAEKLKEKQKAYRDAHKEELNAKRRKGAKCMCPCDCSHPEAVVVETPPQAPPRPPPPPPRIPNKPPPPPKKISGQTILNEMEGKMGDAKKNTSKTHKISFKRILPFLKNQEDIIASLKDLEWIKRAKEALALNTYKASITAVLKVANLFDFEKNIPHEEYKTELILSNEESKQKNKEENEDTNLIPIDEFLKKVIDTTAEYSKFQALIRLYNEMTLRDDYYDMVISKNPEETTTSNILFIPEDKNEKITIYLQRGKTIEKHNLMAQGVELSKSLSDYIREYIRIHKLKYGETIFGKSPLSGYISQIMQSQYGYKNGINTLRRMKTKWMDVNQVSERERINISKIMGHSISQQKTTYTTG